VTTLDGLAPRDLALHVRRLGIRICPVCGAAWAWDGMVCGMAAGAPHAPTTWPWL